MHVGLDAHKKHTVGFIVHLDGRREGPFKFKTTKEELARRAGAWEGARVVVEASSTGKGVVRVLGELGVDALLVHPDALMMTLRSKKTDETDAEHLALVSRLDALRVSYTPTFYEEGLRTLSRHRRDLTHRLTQLQVMAKSVLQRNLVEAPAGRLTRLSCRRRYQNLDLPSTEKFALKQILNEIEFVANQRDVTKLQIMSQTQDDEDIKLLLSIPGVDVMNAAMIKGELGDIRRFPSPKHAASYAGLTPRTWQSGATSVTGRISKRGSPHLRHALVEAVHQAQRYDGPIRQTYRRLRPRIGTGKALVACARRLVHVITAMLKNREEYAGTQTTDMTQIKRWRHHAITTCLGQGESAEALRLLLSQDPRREHQKWTSNHSGDS